MNVSVVDELGKNCFQILKNNSNNKNNNNNTPNKPKPVSSKPLIFGPLAGRGPEAKGRSGPDSKAGGGQGRGQSALERAEWFRAGTGKQGLRKRKSAGAEPVQRPSQLIGGVLSPPGGQL